MKSKEEYNKYQRVYQLNRYHNRRNESILFLGGCCSSCGSKENLQLDHKEWESKTFSIGKLWSVSKQRFIEELLKCQLLCDSCHRIKTGNDIREQRKQKGWANQYGSGPSMVV